MTAISLRTAPRNPLRCSLTIGAATGTMTLAVVSSLPSGVSTRCVEKHLPNAPSLPSNHKFKVP